MIALLAWWSGGYALSGLLVRRLPSAGTILATGMCLYILAGIIAALSGQWAVVGVVFPFLAIVAGVLVHLRRRSHLSPAPPAPIREGGRRPRFPEAILPGLLILLLLAWGVLALLQSRVPIASYDVLSYHVPLAQAFGGDDAGRRVFLFPETFYARLPLGAPILEAPFLSPGWGGVNGFGLQLFVLLTVLAAATSAARLTGWMGGRREVRLLAALLLLYLPMVTNSMLAGLFDPALALMALAALEWMFIAAARGNRRGAWAVAGLLAGSAVALKLNAVGVVLIPLLAVGVVLAWPAGGKNRMYGAGLLLAGALAAMLPWMIRGLPVGPMAAYGAEWTPEQAAFVIDAHEPLAPLGPDWWSGFVMKLGTLGYPIPMTGLSGLLILSLAFPWLLYRRGRDHRLSLLIVLAALAGFGAWLCVRHNPARFLLPSVALLTIPSALCLGMIRWKGRCGPLVGFLLFGALCWAPSAVPRLLDAPRLGGSWHPGERDLMTGEFLGQSVMQIVRSARGQAEGGSHLLLFFEARMGLFPENVTGRTVWDQPPWAPLLKRSDSPEEFLNLLRLAGYSGILVNEFEWGRLLDFYARGELPGAEPLRGRIGFTSRVLPGEEIRAGLAAYPPHRFAGLTERDLTILHDFLLTCRGGTVLALSAGPGAEIWLARLPTTFPVETPSAPPDETTDS